MKANKTFYHILEKTNEGETGHQGFCEDKKEAEQKRDRLQSFFDTSNFYIWESKTNEVPPIAL